MYNNLKEIIDVNNLQIYKPYSYRYFVDNYKMRYDSIFKKYKRKLHSKYDYFITFPLANKKSFYIKGNLENILKYLKDNYSNKIEYIEILNCNRKDYYKDVYQYCYFENNKENFLCEEYKNQYGRILYKRSKDNKVWDKHFYDEIEKGFVYHRYEDDICIWRGSYEMQYNFKSKKCRVHKWMPLSSGKDVEFSNEDKEFIEKILKRMANKKYKGFYNEDINLIKDLI